MLKINKSGDDKRDVVSPAATVRCECNGRSRYCLRDTRGFHCVDCQGNTEGRHCERCKDGFYLQGAGRSCTPCRCNATGEKPPSAAVVCKRLVLLTSSRPFRFCRCSVRQQGALQLQGRRLRRQVWPLRRRTHRTERLLAKVKKEKSDLMNAAKLAKFSVL